MDLFTSLAHPWGATLTYVLPEYLLGVRAITLGHKTFVLQPAVGYLGLKEASGRVLTPFGAINATWCVNGTEAILTVEVPENVPGTLRLPVGWVEKTPRRSSGNLELLPGHHRLVMSSP